MEFPQHGWQKINVWQNGVQFTKLYCAVLCAMTSLNIGLYTSLCKCRCPYSFSCHKYEIAPIYLKIFLFCSSTICPLYLQFSHKNVHFLIYAVNTLFHFLLDDINVLFISHFKVVTSMAHAFTVVQTF